MRNSICDPAARRGDVRVGQWLSDAVASPQRRRFQKIGPKVQGSQLRVATTMCYSTAKHPSFSSSIARSHSVIGNASSSVSRTIPKPRSFCPCPPLTSPLPTLHPHDTHLASSLTSYRFCHWSGDRKATSVPPRTQTPIHPPASLRYVPSSSRP